MRVSALRVSALLVILLFVPPCVPQARRYDVEEEALKLFHEDLRSVVARFRRSPEYLKILRDKVTEMFRELEIKEAYMFLAQKETIEKRVQDIISKNSTASVDCVSETAAGETTPALAQFRRTEEPTTKPGLGVTLLDNYYKFSDRLQVIDRNKLRNIGFEEAGNLIHKIIKAMSSEEVNDTATTEAATPGEKPAGLDAPEDGVVAEETAGGEETTAHVSVHTVTTEESTTLLPPAEETPEAAAEETPAPEGDTEAPPPESKVKLRKKTEKTKASKGQLTKTTRPPKTTKPIKSKATKQAQPTTTKSAKTPKSTTSKPPKTTKLKRAITTTVKTTKAKTTTLNTTKGKKPLRTSSMSHYDKFLSMLNK